jgi:signal transduction histidine kinase
MQRMLGVLRAAQPPDAVPAPGRLASVDALLEPARAAGISAELAVTGTVRPLPPGVDLAAYRIVQEAVTNVLKHAGATRLTCTVHHGPRAVELRVEDDGTGGAVAGSAGHGQAGMRERAALYGGSVQTGPRPGGGYLVSAVLPVAEGAPERTAVPRGRDVP